MATNSIKRENLSASNQITREKPNAFEHNNNNVDIVGRMNASVVLVKREGNGKADWGKYGLSVERPPAPDKRSVSARDKCEMAAKKELENVRSLNKLDNLRSERKNSSDISKPNLVDSSLSSKQTVSGRRISTGAEMMTKFAPRPYRAAADVDAKVVRTRSQSVEASGPRSAAVIVPDVRSSPSVSSSFARVKARADDGIDWVNWGNRNFSKDHASVGDGLKEGKLSTTAAAAAVATGPVAVTTRPSVVRHGSATTMTTGTTPASPGGGSESAPKSKAVSPRSSNHVKEVNSTATKEQTRSLGPNDLDWMPTDKKEISKTSIVISYPTVSCKTSNVNVRLTNQSPAVASQTPKPESTSSAKNSARELPSIGKSAVQQRGSGVSSNLKSDESAFEKSGTFTARPVSDVAARNSVSSSVGGAANTAVIHSRRNTCSKESSDNSRQNATVRHVEISNHDGLLDDSKQVIGSTAASTSGPPAKATNPTVGTSSSSSSSSAVKHRALIKTGPEALLYSSSGSKDAEVPSTFQKSSTKASKGIERERAKEDFSPASQNSDSNAIVAGPEIRSSTSPLSACGSVRLLSDSKSEISSACSSKKLSLSSCRAVTPPASSSPHSSSVSSLRSLDSPLSPSDSAHSSTDSLVVVESPSLPSTDDLQNVNIVDSGKPTRVDTSTDSVNSALSILMKTQATSVCGGMVPASPKCSYRYGSRGAISSIYRDKLGPGASNQYHKNMDNLYGDFFSSMKGHAYTDRRGSAAASTAAAIPNDLAAKKQQALSLTAASSPSQESPVTVRRTSHERQESSSARNADSTMILNPNQITDSISLYLCPNDRRKRLNAPQPVRRVLSCDSASGYRTGILGNSSSAAAAAQSRRLFFEGSDLRRSDEKDVNGEPRSPSSPLSPYDSSIDADARFIDEVPSENDSSSSSSGFRRSTPSSLRRSAGAGGRRPLLRRHVSFEPASLLLNAALEGELDLVKDTIPKVKDAVVSNDSCTTALHNSIYSGHLEVCRFLIEYGMKVNATDSFGWTPLHCAASCNNVALAKLLVESGSTIFATTFTDRETPMQKCTKHMPGYDDCYRYLNDQSQTVGITNGGIVYATSDYESNGADELTFKEGNQLRIIRKGDETEMEWWWARSMETGGKLQGYVPRNYLALYPSKSKPRQSNGLASSCEKQDCSR